MTTVPSQLVGTIATLWRYPVKSMRGEELNSAEITTRGLRGDRAYAVIDAETGKVASAKHPKNGAGCSIVAPYRSRLTHRRTAHRCLSCCLTEPGRQAARRSWTSDCRPSWVDRCA